MSGDPRASERARREEALQHRGEVVRGSGRALEPRSVPQVVSLRLSPELITALRALAELRGTSVSELLREGAESVIARSAASPVFWRLSDVHGARPGTTARIGDAASTTSALLERDELSAASG